MKTEDGYELAHPGRRFQGQFIDGLVAIALFAAGFFVVGLAGRSGVVYDVLICAIPSVYFLLADAMPHGQSVGKRLLGMSVVDRRTGSFCTLGQSFLRNLITPILGVIDAVAIFFPGHRRLGDMLAGTIVVNRKAG